MEDLEQLPAWSASMDQGSDSVPGSKRHVYSSHWALFGHYVLVQKVSEMKSKDRGGQKNCLQDCQVFWADMSIFGHREPMKQHFPSALAGAGCSSQTPGGGGNHQEWPAIVVQALG